MEELNYKFKIPITYGDSFDEEIEIYSYYVGAFNYNWHKHVECLIVLNGKLEACINGITYTLEKDDICLIDSKQGHVTLSKEKDTIALVVHFSPKIYHSLIGEDKLLIWEGRTDKNNRYSFYANRIRKNICLIVDSLIENNGLKKLERLIAFQSIILDIIILFSNFESNRQITSVNKDELETIKKIITYLNNNYRKKIKLQDLANLVGYHPNYTSDLFSRLVGIPFTEYLQMYRLSNATKDLKQSSKLISDVALDNGFSNVKSFNLTFRETFNRSPSTYRASLDDETKQIDAEFKKVFVDVRSNYYQNFRKRWSYYDGKNDETKNNLFECVSCKNKVYDEMIDYLVSKKNKK